MLEIHLRGSDSPIMCSTGLEPLLHDVRVIQGVPFLELVDGDLVNLTEVVRITEQRDLDPGAPAAVEECEHGFIKSTCTLCKAVVDVEAQQWVGGMAPPICETCGAQHVGTCLDPWANPDLIERRDP